MLSRANAIVNAVQTDTVVAILEKAHGRTVYDFIAVPEITRVSHHSSGRRGGQTLTITGKYTPHDNSAVLHFFKMAQHLDSRCVLLSDPSTFRAGCKTPVQRSLNHNLFMIAFLGNQFTSNCSKVDVRLGGAVCHAVSCTRTQIKCVVGMKPSHEGHNDISGSRGVAWTIFEQLGSDVFTKDIGSFDDPSTWLQDTERGLRLGTIKPAVRASWVGLDVLAATDHAQLMRRARHEGRHLVLLGEGW